MKNKKKVVGIFAHPDDEAFGPGGTLAILARENDVYIICATGGESGKGGNNLKQVRVKELQEAAKVLGIKKVYFLDFIDGTLSNNFYHTLAYKIEVILKKLRPETIITFEPLGISGHIDHIAVALATTYVSKKLSFVKKIMYHCATYQEFQNMRDYFIYFPPGFKKKDIDEVINIEDVWKLKIKAMKCHKSQMHDVKWILNNMKKMPKEECFLTKIHR